MLGVAGAALGWVVLVCLPGLFLCVALRAPAGLIRNLSLAPIVGVGVMMAVGEVLQLGGIAIRPLAVLPLSLGIPALVWLARGHVPILRGTRKRGEPENDGVARQGRLLLGMAMIAGLITWCASIPSVGSVLPSTDGSHHGLYAHRILAVQTLDPKIVLSGDVSTHSPTWHYYPLAIHLCAAMISGVTGVAVNTVLTVGMVLAAAIVLPVGIFVLTRRLFPGNDTIAGTAALLSATFAWFPFAPILWGGMPLIVAMSQVPSGVDALWRKRDDGSDLSLGLLLGIAGYGLFEAHNSELLSAILLGVVLLAFTWRASSATERRSALMTLGVGAVAFGLCVAPDVPALTGGLDERGAYISYQFATGGLTPIGWFIGVGNPLVLIFACAGLVVTIRRGSCRGWHACLAATTLLFLATFLRFEPFRSLTTPWYSVGARVSYLFAFFEATLGAVGIVLGLPLAVRLLRRRNAVRPRLASALPVVAFAILYFALVSVQSHSFVALAYREGSKVDADQRAGFGWLASHVPTNARVLNEFVDGSGWMETLDGVHPVFASDPETLPVVDPASQWGDRWYLLTHARNLATDPKAQAAAREWNVQYVYVDERSMAQYKSRLSAPLLATSRAYREVWHRGSVTIFSVNLAPLSG